VKSTVPTVGDRVTLTVPGNVRLDGTAATIREYVPPDPAAGVGGYYVVAAPAAASGQFRALPEELVTPEPCEKRQLREISGRPRRSPDRQEATGDVCPNCGGSDVRQSGTCKTCFGCGESVGGCS
jgi:hypothetical protein